MGVWASAGNFSRAVSELGLTTVEQQRMLRNNNIVTSGFMAEKDARAQEKGEQDLKAADLSFKKLSAQKSREAAELAQLGAALNLLGTLLKVGVSAGTGQKTNWAQAIPDIVNGFGNYMTKTLDKLKARAEEEAVQEDLNRLNGQRAQTEEAVQALDSNPYG